MHYFVMTTSYKTSESKLKLKLDFSDAFDLHVMQGYSRCFRRLLRLSRLQCHCAGRWLGWLEYRR